MSTRSNLISRVTDLLVAGSNVAIHAMPGAGKTWVADSAIECLSVRGINAIRVDMSILGTGSDVFNLVTSSLPNTPSSSQQSARDAWADLTSSLKVSVEPVVLVLDEFDAAIEYPDALDFLRFLRELVHRPKTTLCNVLIVSRRPLEAIEKSVRGISTLASVCCSEYVGAVTENDLRDGWMVDLSLSERIDCIDWSGGHASLVQYWVAARPDLNQSDSAENHQAEVMKRITKYLDGLGLIDAAAQLVLGPIVEDWLRERKQLTALGVIARDAEDDRVTLSAHEIFRESLRRQTWDLNPWGVLGEAEVRVRGLIEVLMTSHCGHDWIDAAKGRSRGVASAFESATEKQKRDARQFGRPGAWLAYTYPSDLWTILSAEWKYFSPVFSSQEKKDWRAKFETLASYRTPMAHNRAESLSAAQRVQCKLYSEEILSAIDHYEASNEVLDQVTK